MIINIRGTSGSGKSQLVRNIMALYGRKDPLIVPGRKQPIGYVCHRPSGAPLFVVGHYETACGGCDTIMGNDRIYDAVHGAAESGSDVVFEGLIIQSDVKRAIALKDKYKIVILALNTPIEVCLASVQMRREARGDFRELNSANTIGKWKTVLSQEKIFKNAGVDFRWVNRFEGIQTATELLGWNHVVNAPNI